jgi:hypothetical protein
MSGDLLTAFAASLVAAIVTGLVLAVAPRGRPPFTRLARGLAPVLVVIVAWGWWVALVAEPVVPLWSGARLAPALDLRQGHPLYHPDGQGPVSGWIYPPLSALAYLPATFWGDGADMILAGKVLSLLFYFGPVALVLTREWRRGRVSAEMAVVLFAAFALLTAAMRPLRYVATEVIADAPALGLGALALAALGSVRGAGPTRPLVLAAAAATLATWSKQLAVPLLLLVPVWCGVTGGLRALVRGLAVTAAVAAVVSLPLALAFGPRELWFNTVVLPSRHPWKSFPPPGGFAAVLPRLALHEWPVLAPLLLLLAARAVVTRRQRRKGAPIDPAPPWMPFLAAGMLEVPLGLLGFVKVGGDENSLAHFLYPLAVAALLLASQLMTTLPALKWVVVVAAVAAAVPDAVQTGLVLARRSAPPPPGAPRAPDWIDEHRAVARYLRDHPGEAYFPCHPLEHLTVDGRQYHFEYGVFDRFLAGFPVPEGQLREYVPPHARYVCYPDGSVAGYAMCRLLPEFRRPVEVGELPGSPCFERAPPPER